jgi:hypothetical protein
MLQIIFICETRLSKSLRRPLISTLPETRFSGRVLHNKRLLYLVHPYLSGHFLKECWLLSLPVSICPELSVLYYAAYSSPGDCQAGLAMLLSYPDFGYNWLLA